MNTDMKYNSISSLKEDGVYEIHPCGDSTVSGYIEVKDGVIKDLETNEVYTSEDIFNIECFEEEHTVLYIKVK